MQIKIKYLVGRKNRDGSKRYYWDRPGFELAKLGKDPIRAAQAATNLNNEAEGKKPDYIGSQVGTVNWVMDLYKTTEIWLVLSEGSKSVYGPSIRRIGRILGDIPIQEIRRSNVRALMASIPTVGGKIKAAAVLSNLFKTAIDEDLITVNHALKLGLSKGDGRTEWFATEAVAAWMAAAEKHPAGQIMITKFWLLYYTGQRVNDCLLMPGGRYDGDTVLLRQQKTRHLMRVPTHLRLRAYLETVELVDEEPIGGTISYQQFHTFWVEICEAAGLEDMQARDLRRTAVILLAEAGCSDVEISSITGHTLASIKPILDSNYLVRTDVMARSAIDKWEARDAEIVQKLERGVRKIDAK